MFIKSKLGALLITSLVLSSFASPAFAGPYCAGGWGVKKNKLGTNCPTPEQKLKGKAVAKNISCIACHGPSRNAPTLPPPEELPDGENGAVAGSWQKMVQLMIEAYDPDGSKAAAGKYPTPNDLIALYDEYADYMTSDIIDVTRPSVAQARQILKFMETMKP